MAPIISECTQVTMNGITSGGRPWSIVQHWIGSGLTPPDPYIGSTKWVQAFVDYVLIGLCHDTSVTGGSFIDLSSSGGASGPIGALTGPLTGGDSGFMAPPNVCVLVKMATLNSRSQRSGRMYLPGVNEDQLQANGALTDTYQDDTQAAIATWWDYLDSQNIVPVVNSKASAGSYEPTTITSMDVQALAATQRRRLRK